MWLNLVIRGNQERELFRSAIITVHHHQNSVVGEFAASVKTPPMTSVELCIFIDRSYISGHDRIAMAIVWFVRFQIQESQDERATTYLYNLRIGPCLNSNSCP